MLDLYKNIKKLRIERGLSQQELAELTGYTDRSSIAKIEKGEVDLTESKIKAFADALKVRPISLMGWDNLPPFHNIHPVAAKSYPVLGSIACGKPILMVEEKEVQVDATDIPKADYILIAKGDSMIGARINNGDIVFIREQPEVENGEIAAVAIGDEATLKRVYYYREKAMLILKAANPAYEDMIFTGPELEDIHILGKAVKFQSEVI